MVLPADSLCIGGFFHVCCGFFSCHSLLVICASLQYVQSMRYVLFVIHCWGWIDFFLSVVDFFPVCHGLHRAVVSIHVGAVGNYSIYWLFTFSVTCVPTAKHYENPTMLFLVTAKMSGMFFETPCSNGCINTFPYYRSTFKRRALLSKSCWTSDN